MSERILVKSLPNEPAERWFPSTLNQLGKNERFLEDALASAPELMGLTSRRTGISGPFVQFRQVAMRTPMGRGVHPDLMLFASSGHIIVVEVKLSSNPELRDRAVIAQIIDYASSISSLTEPECVELFGQPGLETWTDCVASLFPQDRDVEELASNFLERMRSGEIHLVIACDRVPAGLADVVAGIASQRTLAFDLDLVEITPFVREVAEEAEILLVPSTRLRTEIVSRTAVTVTYRAGDVQPSTNVQTTSLADIEEKMSAARSGRSAEKRPWTTEEILREIRQRPDAETGLAIFEFCQAHTAPGHLLPESPTAKSIVKFVVEGLAKDGKPCLQTILSYRIPQDVVRFNTKFASKLVPTPVMDELRTKLAALPGLAVTSERPSFPLSAIRESWDEFQQTFLWFQAEAHAAAETRRNGAR